MSIGAPSAPSPPPGSEQEQKALREEIEDLSSYLEGLPDELRASVAFDGYRARLADLRGRLVPREHESEVDLHRHVHELEASVVQLRATHDEALASLERMTKRNQRLWRWLNVATLLVASSVAFTLAVPSVALLLALAGGALAVSLFWVDRPAG